MALGRRSNRRRDRFTIIRSFCTYWVEGLRPLKAALIPALTNICRLTGTTGGVRSLATNILADYADDVEHLPLLTDLLLGGTDSQFGSLFPKLKQYPEPAIKLLREELKRPERADASRGRKKNCSPSAKPRPRRR